jgi:hypothetical protein
MAQWAKPFVRKVMDLCSETETVAFVPRKEKPQHSPNKLGSKRGSVVTVSPPENNEIYKMI